MKENNTKILYFVFVGTLALARMGHGFFWAIPGPTLPSLEDNVGEDNVSSI